VGLDINPCPKCHVPHKRRGESVLVLEHQRPGLLNRHALRRDVRVAALVVVLLAEETVQFRHESIEFLRRRGRQRGGVVEIRERHYRAPSSISYAPTYWSSSNVWLSADPSPIVTWSA